MKSHGRGDEADRPRTGSGAERGGAERAPCPGGDSTLTPPS